MLQSEELPLAEVLTADQWQTVFDKHEVDFGNDEDVIYTPVITLWALISQAFFKAEMRSCKAAVGRAKVNRQVRHITFMELEVVGWP